MLVHVPRYRMTITVISPFLRAVCIMFAFPDWGFVFDPVDDITVGSISLATMGRSRDHDNSRITHSHLPNTMLRYCNMQLPFLAGRLQYLFYKLCSQRRIRFVFEKIDCLAPVAVPHFSAEEDNSPRTGMMGAGQQPHDIQRIGRERRDH